MSKQKLKKVLVRLEDITICDKGPHYARWDVNGVFQQWISKKDLEKIYLMHKTRPLKMMLRTQFKK